MERHLQNCHSLSINIQKQSSSRPKNSARPPLPMSSRSSRQCEARFYDINLRVNKARKKHLCDVRKSAPSAWNKRESKDTITFEEWLPDYIKNEMDTWEREMPSRLVTMQRHINRGYHASVSILLAIYI